MVSVVGSIYSTPFISLDCRRTVSEVQSLEQELEGVEHHLTYHGIYVAQCGFAVDDARLGQWAAER